MENLVYPLFIKKIKIHIMNPYTLLLVATVMFIFYTLCPAEDVNTVKFCHGTRPWHIPASRYERFFCLYGYFF